MNPARTTIAAALAAAPVLTGCGSGRDNTGADSTQLRRDMQAVAAAAAAHNYVAAASALNALNADAAAAAAAAAHASGTLDDSQLAAIRSALAKVQADLTAATTRPPTTITATPTRPTKAPSGKHNGGPGHGDGDGDGDGD